MNNRWVSEAVGKVRRGRGLTLIELMVVVVVLAILGTIALPTYERYQRGSRRADGKAALTAVAQAQERAFSVYQTYVSLGSLDDLAGLDSELANGGDGNSPKRRYTVTIPDLSADGFRIQAAPHNWTDPDCGNLYLRSTGVTSVDGPKATAYCW